MEENVSMIRFKKSSPKIQATYEFLLNNSFEGKFLEYSTIEKAIGFDCKKQRYIMDTARKKLFNRKKVHWIPVRDMKGLRCSTDGEKINESEHHRDKSRRQMKKSRKLLDAIENYNSLSIEEKNRVNVGMAMTGAMLLFLQKRTIAEMNFLANGMKKQVENSPKSIDAEAVFSMVQKMNFL